MSKVLVVLSNHRELPGRSYQTGFWFSELVHFYYTLQKAGVETEFISPRGGKAAIDARSLTRMHLDRFSDQFLDNEPFMQKIHRTKAADQINPEEYRGIFFVGGEGVLYDVVGNKSLQQLARKIFDNLGVVSAVSHGVLALLDIKSESGEQLVARKTLTGLLQVEQMLLEKRRRLIRSVQNEIPKYQAFYAGTHWIFTSFVVCDGRIITGQNPASVVPLAWQIIRMVNPSTPTKRKPFGFISRRARRAKAPDQQVSHADQPTEVQQS